MSRHTPNILRAGLFTLMCVFTLAIVLTTAGNMKTVKSLAWLSLENSALAISTAAESALIMKNMISGEDFRNILADRVVAYALIADSAGKILFHTNSGLEGYIIKGFSPPGTDRPSGRKIILGTGIEAYEYVFPLKTSEKSNRYLMLVMNTAETLDAISKAGRIWWTAGIVIMLLWVTGILFERLALRSIKLEAEVQRQRELGMIGQMTSVLAHEIRNALGGLKGYAQWADEKTDTADSKKQALGFIIEGADRIGALVNEMLLFSKQETYENEKIELKPFVDALINETLSSWNGLSETSIDGFIYVKADKEKFKRVLVNGIINARESASNDGLIMVTGRIIGNVVEIRIEDNGAGLKKEELDKIFTPFYTTKTNGTGLGLAYARKVINGMGGTISIYNRNNPKGAVLVIEIPGGKGE
jgi:two-component system, NtrC family, sensor histidine kinase HydH